MYQGIVNQRAAGNDGAFQRVLLLSRSAGGLFVSGCFVSDAQERADRRFHVAGFLARRVARNVMGSADIHIERGSHRVADNRLAQSAARALCRVPDMSFALGRVAVRDRRAAGHGFVPGAAFPEFQVP